MHPDHSFRHDDTSLRDRMIREHPFATIFLTVPAGPRAAHTPIELVGPDTLHFHLARQNVLTDHLDGARPLVVVNGPDAYVSARWYAADNQVSTWNYVAYELEGPVTRFEDGQMRPFLERLSDHHENHVAAGEPWTMAKVGEDRIAAMMQGIVGFRMTIESVRETVKLSQNKSESERAGVIAGLEREGSEGVARLMRQVDP
ncbi:FMN-binding negative transcriptional regulator [Erythrobacter sp.]|uniref:FMN-binding negative transcriptional regulator n=1 Tax=Erythrobacter sp. TaxID=1042 RepID=UPI003C780B37